MSSDTLTVLLTDWVVRIACLYLVLSDPEFVLNLEADFAALYLLVRDPGLVLILGAETYE